ncbi:hypothetical protein EB72_19360 [Mycobacterium sp. SWH-M1]|nr:hypothetical protein EB72_19360 [Mycobacterium sp. SWH-M1]
MLRYSDIAGRFGHERLTRVLALLESKDFVPADGVVDNQRKLYWEALRSAVKLRSHCQTANDHCSQFRSHPINVTEDNGEVLATVYR